MNLMPRQALRGFAFLAIMAATPCLANKQALRRIDDTSFAALEDGRGLHLDVRVTASTEMEQALRFYTGTFQGKPLPLAIKRVSKTRAYIPFENLSPVYRRQVISVLWPKNKQTKNHYRHVVSYSGHETLWSISAWLTGKGQNHKAISRATGINGSRIRKGVVIEIPLSLLDDALIFKTIEDEQVSVDPVIANRTPIHTTTEIKADRPIPSATRPGKVEPKAPAKQPVPQVESTPIPELSAELVDMRRGLRFGTDEKGKYAEYRLRRGEAIYSAVVVRFCGLVSGEDVNRVAGLVIKRNGIRDETDLPIGYPIRIPYEYLEPEFREADDPDYLAYFKNMQEVSQLTTKVVSRNLQGVYVILDSGHGGRDTGAKFGDVWEDDFVYDIVCRVKQRLENETQAVVLTTTFDPSVQYRVQDVPKFRLDHDEVLLTNPKYPLNHRRVTTDGVNLRWMFANHKFQQLKKQGIKPENVVFASFHADSLHHSIRGAMIYIPDALYYPKKVGPPSSRFSGYQEYSGNSFSFGKDSMQDAQARSLAFAQVFIQQAKLSDINVHRSKPIRSVIRRHAHSRPFVPAVLRYNRIPTRCLIEVCNLANKSDRALLRQHDFRQAIADTFVSGLYTTYGLDVPQLAQKSTQTRASK